jgi:hypothetical protein
MGKPTAGNAAVPFTEYIGGEEQTRGSETSQYPEEKKTRVIPLVVASERGRGQTAAGNCVGVAGPRKDHWLIAETLGKACHRG